MSVASSQAALGKFAEAVATGNYALFNDVVAPDCVDHDPAAGQVPGPEGYKFVHGMLRKAFPDIKLEPTVIVQQEDTIAFAYTMTGTQTGPFGDIPPSGKPVKINGLQISKFKDGKMVERWGSSDVLGILKQIGAVK
jgi:steroid delta-isomerase-like uncharacterized protein